MSFPRMLKINVNQAFLESSLHKGMSPLSSTDISRNIMNSATDTISPYITAFSKRFSTLSSVAAPRSIVILKRRQSAVSIAPFSFWNTAMTLALITMLTVISPFGSTALHTQAVPAKHRPSSKNVLNDMSISYSDNSPMPLQLQIESQTMGKQTLEYLPTTGQSIDFHYINYRPLHQAGESQMDFWMLTPKGTPAPKTGSLELYDEFGKVRLAVLVPEGTEIPQDIANKNVPFFWKSWVIPKTLDADFNFSERFRVVLKTSDSKHLVEADIKYNKREDLGFELKVKGKNKHINDADNADTIVSPSRSGIAIVQDHQFRIEELEAMPGE